MSPEDALAAASRGLATAYPEREVLLGLRGVALLRLGRYREAVEALREAERLHPSEPQFRTLREEAERKRGGG